MARQPGVYTPTFRRNTRPCLRCGGKRSCRWTGTVWACSHPCTATFSSADDAVLYAPPFTVPDQDLIAPTRRWT